MVTTKRCAYGTSKNDSWYPKSWVRNAKGDPIKFFHFPGEVRESEREGKSGYWLVIAVTRLCVRRTVTFVLYTLSEVMVEHSRIQIQYLLWKAKLTCFESVI